MDENAEFLLAQGNEAVAQSASVLATALNSLSDAIASGVVPAEHVESLRRGGPVFMASAKLLQFRIVQLYAALDRVENLVWAVTPKDRQ